MRVPARSRRARHTDAIVYLVTAVGVADLVASVVAVLNRKQAVAAIT